MKKILISLSALAMASAPAHAVTLYGIDEVNNLVTYDSAAAGTTLSSVAITGIGGSSILAMDFRVRDGFLYALSDNFDLYRINQNTGVSVLVSALALTGSNFAFDFNPTNANLRIISNDNSNYVYNFMTNALVVGPNVSYGVGGPNPDITAAGYLFNDNDATTGTVLYGIDTANDLFSTVNTTTGALTTVGSLGVNLGSRTSFDIYTAGTTNIPFVQDGNRLYNINLATGGLTQIGTTDRAIFALSAAIPEPATWGMMILGFGAVGAVARVGRRQRKVRTVTA